MVFGRSNAPVFQPQQPQLPASASGFRQPQRSGVGLGGSLASAGMQQAVNRPVAQAPFASGKMSMNMSNSPSYARMMARRNAPQTGADAMTGVSRRQFAGQPNAVEAARSQGAGLGGSLPQPKQYSNAPNIVNYTNRTYAAPAQQQQVGQPVGGTALTVPPSQQPQQPPQQALPNPVPGPVAQPAPPNAPGPVNERALRDKEAMQ